MKSLKKFCITVLFLGAGCYLQSLEAAAQNYYPPPESQGGWRKHTEPAFVSSLGLHPARLTDLLKYAVSTSSGAGDANRACLVIKGGWVVAEGYSRPAAQTTKLDLHSNFKAVDIALYGMIFADSAAGRLPAAIGANSKLYDPRWLPEGFPLSDARKSQITFEHIFRHTSGIGPEANGVNYAYVAGAPDLAAAVTGRDPTRPLAALLYFDPGTQVGYGTVAPMHLWLVVPHLTGLTHKDYRADRLLVPLGCQLPVDRSLLLTPSDYARFAYFLIRDGKWGAQQLVPATWIQRFRNSGDYPNIQSNVRGYFNSKYAGSYPQDLFEIAGAGLNVGFLVPSLDLVVVRTGASFSVDWNQFHAAFLQKLSSAIVSRPVATAPSITTQPAGRSVAAGQTATFAVRAAGTAPLAYQWQKNGTNIAGATGASYTTPATVAGDNGATYRAIVTNAAGSPTSSPATLTVTATNVAQWGRFETSLAASGTYANPYQDVSLAATFRHLASGQTLVLDGFWDGGNTWRFRMSPTQTGDWIFTTTSNDAGLNGKTGGFTCVSSSRPGFLKIHPENKFAFTHANGSPFFYLGETPKLLMTSGYPYNTGFKSYVDNRSQTFTYFHTHVLGDRSFWDYGTSFAADAMNEGGFPFTPINNQYFKLDRANPAYFQWMDRRMDYLDVKGMVTALVLMDSGPYSIFQTNPDTEIQRYIRYRKSTCEIPLRSLATTGLVTWS